jgi:hypothetical protein
MDGCNDARRWLTGTLLAQEKGSIEPRLGFSHARAKPLVVEKIKWSVDGGEQPFVVLDIEGSYKSAFANCGRGCSGRVLLLMTRLGHSRTAFPQCGLTVMA